ncbi:MAG: amino acid permease [Anaerolineae bacterium]|nr:amino acid permease [Chloroflexota bacterium]
MSSQQRSLRREMGLGQVLLMGVAGTIAAEIFVLTGHVAGITGPASVLAMALIGLLCGAFALNYAELAVAYPVTGGALTYVRQAYGVGLLSFLVGSMDCLSSAFYASLSAVGFAYSLRIFLPWIPIVPTAILVVLVFTALQALGISKVARAQSALGAALLILLVIYVVRGFTSPVGFSLQTLMPDGRFWIGDTPWHDLKGLFRTMALVFNAYIGFEIIADDAEEIRDYRRNIPVGILVSLGIITLLYVSSTAVTLGTVPWTQLAGSEEALAIAAQRLMPRWGAPLIGVAGIIATLTSINTAMLAATREAFSLSRMALWPRVLSRLGRIRTPWVAALVIGAVVALMASIGLVDFLSYVSSSGYLFVVIFASLAMIRLRKTDGLERSFKAPLFPLTALIAVATCVLSITFTSGTALAFGAGLLAALSVMYYVREPVTRAFQQRAHASSLATGRLLVAVANPGTAQRLVQVAADLAENQHGTMVEVLTVHPELEGAPVERLRTRYGRRPSELQREVASALAERNVPWYTETAVAPRVSDGIVREVNTHRDVQLILMGWPGPVAPDQVLHHPLAQVLAEAHTDVAALLDRNANAFRRVLVPFGGGVHSRLAVRLALQLTAPYEGEVVVLRCFLEREGEPAERPGADEETTPLEDEFLLLQEELESALGQVPTNLHYKVVTEPGLLRGILTELQDGPFDLVVMGAAVARSLKTEFFGSIADAIADQIPTSVLLVRRYELQAMGWMRRQIKALTPVSGRHRALAGEEPDAGPAATPTEHRP